ncbi:outer membrane protein OmpA-like peptidoglycan-associated protein [Dysgonomonas hofstadii]|uniref:Outer membrane protein OmpA-like peptidoglycan-associated protein n=1 Tax=Dysgonomonas hofstadii TaxID=637886 RepID=A0A840CTX5_9BACT|nr:OmpA family protein [Dysgonomonas hofstadii]MBB4035143.1 outer membrane protein OmpA-like peptidoglycan-associated protein [Dysgonomonas hofstadii]
MKKLVFSIAALALAAMPALAQEKAFAPNKFGDNWFIQLQGGASYTISEDRSSASFGDLITPHAAVSLGKYFSPAVGARLQVGGWSSKNYYDFTGGEALYGASNGLTGTYKNKYIQTNLDGILNLTNLFLPYKPDRVFNFSILAGLGYVHGFKDSEYALTTTNMIVPRAGVQFDFRVSEIASLNLEVAGNLLRDDFNGRTQAASYDGTVNALLGVTFNLTKGGFKMVDVQDPAQLKALNDQINAQRASLDSKDSEISRLKRDLAVKPEPQVIVKETKEVKEQTEVLMNAVVVFRLGSAQLEKNQDINIFNAARYLQDNPGVNVTVTGYADKSTGTAAVNQRLSEQRAQAVAKVLIDKYNISPSRITTKASGDKEQLFPTDEWNRVVVFTATSK